MKRPIPQFFAVNYARVGDQTRIGWFSRRVPDAGMAYFGFSDRALAERFTAVVPLDDPGSATMRGGRWIPTFLGYPELRRQLDGARAQGTGTVNLLVNDAKSFNDPAFNAAPIDTVIEALAANPGVESGIEVEFEVYSNVPSKPISAPVDALRLMPVGEACVMPIHNPPPTRTAWVLRRSDPQIAPIRRHPDCKNLQRAMSVRVTLPGNGAEVRLVALAIALGFEPFTPETISAAFINEYDPVCRGMLENLTIQQRTPIMVVGDTEPADFIAEGQNTLREFAQKTLAVVSSTRAWSRGEFVQCTYLFKQRYPTPQALWERLGQGAS